jgi:hypothetical protein
MQCARGVLTGIFSLDFKDENREFIIPIIGERGGNQTLDPMIISHGADKVSATSSIRILRAVASVRIGRHEHPVVLPHVSHFMQVPFRTSVKFPHSEHISPS